jgi:hypothetical protein
MPCNAVVVSPSACRTRNSTRFNKDDVHPQCDERSPFYEKITDKGLVGAFIRFVFLSDVLQRHR